jgi:hypothetical protein
MSTEIIDEKERRRMESHFRTGADKNTASKFVFNERGANTVLGPDDIKQADTLYIKNCHDCDYQITGKCTKVLIEGCTGCRVTLKGRVITNVVEAWKCENFGLTINTDVKTLQLDMCKKINLQYQSKDRFHQIVWSAVHDLSLLFSDEAHLPPFITGFDHMQKQYPDLHPEIDQFIIRDLSGKITSEQVVRLSNGYPTTEREASEFDAQSEKNEKAAEEFVRRRLAEAGITLGKKNAGPATQKVGRNDNCTCGSGKKFKKCCANKKP